MMMHGWGMGAFPRRFEEQYHCFSVAHADKAHLEVRTRFVSTTGTAVVGRRCSIVRAVTVLVHVRSYSLLVICL
jgi:hypothetical protein